MVMIAWLRALDHRLFDLGNRELIHPWLDIVMPFITEQSRWMPLIALGWLWLLFGGDRTRRTLAVLLLVSVGCTDLVCARLIKPMVARRRPCVSRPATVVLRTRLHESRSFPSNHAANTAAAAATAVFAPGLGPFATGSLVALAGMIAWSRVYVGVHYPADVLAGALIGIGIAGLVTSGWRRWHIRAGHNDRPPESTPPTLTTPPATAPPESPGGG